MPILHVAVCDDEEAVARLLRERVAAWAAARGGAVSTRLYPGAEAFLFARGEGAPADILLLDIQMGPMDGVALARELRRRDDALQIVFITGYPDFMQQGYEVDALHYLMKPVSDESLFGVLDKAAKRIGRGERTIPLTVGGETTRLPARDILYAEAFSHEVELVTTDGRVRLPRRISDMEKLLGEGFFRCHRSYIVNMAHVRRVTRRAVALSDGTEIPLSRAQYDEANQRLIRGI